MIGKYLLPLMGILLIGTGALVGIAFSREIFDIAGIISLVIMLLGASLFLTSIFWIQFGDK